jgi:predicted phage terminase large subunit-like protein
VQFLHASYAQSLSLRDSVKCRRLIESPWYQRLWGSRFMLTGDQNTKTRFDNDKGGSRLSTSVGSALTGEGGSCFPAGSLVSTPNGPRNIEDLRAGDEVIAFDHSRGKVVKSVVVATAERYSDALWQIHTSQGRSIRCTDDHRIFSPGRGYIPAAELGVGDWLLGEDGAIDIVKSSLRYVPAARNQAAILGKESLKSGQQRQLLLQKMLPIASFVQKQYKTLRGLLQASAQQACALLFGRLQAAGQISAQEEKRMPALRGSIRRMDNVLRSRLRGSGAFKSDAGGKKFAVSRVREVFKSISENVADYKRARQFQMFGMRNPGSKNTSWETQEAFHPVYSSHRRGHQEQSPGKSDNSLFFMSQKASSWQLDDQQFFAGNGKGKIKVYDIQVKDHHNFFVGNILAHNCIIVDDPNSAQEAHSQATIEATIEWWDGALSTRLNDPKTGAFIVIQQRLSEEDLTGHILSKDADNWTHLCLPMRYEPDRSFVTSIGWQDPRTEPGELLWEDRFGEAEVKTLERLMGPWKAAGQLQQRPEPQGGGIIKRDWWQLWMEDAYPAMDYIVASLDTAYTTKTENDFSALTVWGVFSGDVVAQATKVEGGQIERSYGQQHPRVMLMQAWAERLELHELVQKVARTCKSMRVDKLIIENKAAGHSVAQELRRLFGHEDWGVQLLDPKGQDKLARLYSVQHLFAEGMVYAPDRSWADQVITQVGTFPKGKNDDLVDTVSQAMRHLRDLGMLTRGPEFIADIEAGMQHGGKPPAPLYPA